MTISWPFVKVITATSNAILRLFGYSKQTFDEKVSEDEIRSMIVTGHIEGVIDEEEKKCLTQYLNLMILKLKQL